MPVDNALEKLKKTPIVELDLGEVKLRRAMIRTGFESLVDVLELSEKEIDDKFEWREADKIISMKEKYLKDPEGFAASVLKKAGDRPTPDRAKAPKAHYSKLRDSKAEGYDHRDSQGLLLGRWPSLAASIAVFRFPARIRKTGAGGVRRP